MPLYDYKCSTCNSEKIDYFKRIKDNAPECCGIPMCHLFTVSAAVSIFRAGFYEHLAPEPLYFENKRELKRYCKNNDLTMDVLE